MSDSTWNKGVPADATASSLPQSDANPLGGEYQRYLRNQINKNNPVQIAQVSGEGGDTPAVPGDPRAGEATREGQMNKFGDGYARDASGRIDEFQYKGDKHSYKIQYDAKGQPSKIMTPDGRQFTNHGLIGWTVETPPGYIGPDTRTSSVNFGKVTVDENGLHIDNPDRVSTLGLPDGGREPVTPEHKFRLDEVRTTFENGQKVVEARTLHTKFKATYDGENISSIEIEQGNTIAQLTRNPQNDGSYTLHRPGRDDMQVCNVKFDAESRTVAYQDENGKAYILQKGDTIFDKGRPVATAKGL